MVRYIVFTGLGGCCKSARDGLGLPASEVDGVLRPWLMNDCVRVIDAFVRPTREEKERVMLSMHGDDRNQMLFAAAALGCLRDTRFLLAAGADKHADGGRVLVQACWKGNLQVVEAIFEHRGAFSRYQINEALVSAADRGRTACCAFLLDHGASIHYGDDAPLYHAAWNGQAQTVTLLLSRGADAWSEQAMELASTRHQDAIVALLLAWRRD